jgi:hypothetical protein
MEGRRGAPTPTRATARSPEEEKVVAFEKREGKRKARAMARASGSMAARMRVRQRIGAL